MINTEFQTTTNFGFTNFDPNQLQTDEAILATIVADKSGSVDSYVDQMNAAMRDFMAEMKRSSKTKNKLMMSQIRFNDKVEHKHGFQPVLSLQDDALDVQSPSGMTALYDAVELALKEMSDYRTTLENNGTTVSSFIFIITDGEDNSSKNVQDPATRKPGYQVKKLLDDIKGGEEWYGSYSVFMYGVGNQANFEEAADCMGLNPAAIARVGTTATEMRKMIGFISQSVSQSASNQAAAVTF